MAQTINPFECLEFSGGTDFSSGLDHLTARRYVKVRGIQHMIDTRGLTWTLWDLNGGHPVKAESCCAK